MWIHFKWNKEGGDLIPSLADKSGSDLLQRHKLKCSALDEHWKISQSTLMLQDVSKCVIMPLFTEVTDKPRLKPLDSHLTFDLSGFPSVFAPPLWANTRRHGANRQVRFEERWLERAAGIRWSLTSKSTNVSVAQIAVRPVLVFISAFLNGAVDSITVPVLLRVELQLRPPGNLLAESLKATQEELSPAEERLSSSPGCTCGDWPASPQARPENTGELWEDLGENRNPLCTWNAVNGLTGSGSGDLGGRGCRRHQSHGAGTRTGPCCFSLKLTYLQTY